MAAGADAQGDRAADRLRLREQAAAAIGIAGRSRAPLQRLGRKPQVVAAAGAHAFVDQRLRPGVEGHSPDQAIDLAVQALATLEPDEVVDLRQCLLAEAREADLGVASGNGKGQIFVKGEVIKTVPEAQIVETLIEEAMRLAEEMEAAGVPSGEPSVTTS